MRIGIVSYPWAAFKRCYKEAYLADWEHPETQKLFDSYGASFSDRVGHSHGFFLQVGDSLDALLGPWGWKEGRHVLMDTDRSAFKGDRSLSLIRTAFFAESPESDLDVPDIMAVVCGERVDELAAHAASISLPELDEAFRQSTSAEWDSSEEALNEFGRELNYIHEFIGFLISVGGQGLCLTIDIY